ncbi:hypothetical protein [Thiocapsa imhoffii]|uniref:hypothetical protein n=1 Tax=Thiocapsa imhoffii TaxID=382777 RepID=UPI0019049634|nr:hypothetical protein [Thiocapsa imhoffii]
MIVGIRRLIGLTALLGAASICLASESPTDSAPHVLTANEMDSVSAGAASVLSLTTAQAVGSVVYTATSAQGETRQLEGGNGFMTRSDGVAVALGIDGSAFADADSIHTHSNSMSGFRYKQTFNFVGLSISIESSRFLSGN